tara:strand:+ start:452 stop:703 length:252 start_codon:yes stop_codon:yes gene_type:complete
MNEQKNDLIKKKIIYRCTYTGTKETDIFFKKKIVNKIKYLNQDDLIELSNLFEECSDNQIFLMFNKQEKILSKYKCLIAKLNK